MSQVPGVTGDVFLSTPLVELVDHCLKGDQTAMLGLVDRYKHRVFALCFRMLGQRQDAEDAAQETFVRLLKNLSKWDQDRDFEPWLFTIAANRCRTMLAARKCRPTPQPLVAPLADRTPNTALARQLGEEVDLALLRLRMEYRQAFMLFHDQELSYEEIAAALDRPLGTVKTWIHRARIQLIRILCDRGIIETSGRNQRQTRETPHAVSPC
jgi:RNA polymerase sigma-70 factor (ECF subfamily)